MVKKIEILDIIPKTHLVRVEYRFTFDDGTTEESDMSFAGAPEKTEIDDQLRFQYKEREKARKKVKPDYKEMMKDKEKILVE